MGTRSLTTFIDDGTEIAVLYRQYDGYPIGHGSDLAIFLAHRPIVNGIGGEPVEIFNGLPDLAVRTITHLKTINDVDNKAGQFYLYPPGTRDVGEEYVYEVRGQEGDAEATVKVTEAWEDKVIYEGPASGLVAFTDEARAALAEVE